LVWNLLKDQQVLKIKRGGQAMEKIDTTTEILFEEGEAERIETKVKKVSVTRVLLMIPGAIAGFLISTFPLSIPIFYFIALYLTE
jgi:uncharacterized protein YacL